MAARDLAEVAQLAGEGLLIAREQGIEGSDALARRLAAEIRERFLPGDSVLAEQLDAATGPRPPPDLEPMPVDLEALTTHLEGEGLGPDGWLLDVRTGELWPEDPVDMAGLDLPEHWEEPGRWIEIFPLGSRDAWEDVREFIYGIQDPALAERLDRAIQGRGAFRRFKDVLAGHEGLLSTWFRFADDRQRGRARDWLAQ